MIVSRPKTHRRSVTFADELGEEEVPRKKKKTAAEGTTQKKLQVDPEVGIIEKLTLRNFMCHGSTEFNIKPGTNIISGKNGSGKSALLTALVVGLGGKASDTSRGKALKTFIKTDRPGAMVSVQIRNCGGDAYKPDLFGESIIVERRINTTTTTFQLKSAKGRVVSTKKEELGHILEQFNIQVDNPLAILNQDTSRNFLHSANPKNKYQFFLKATKLEKIKHDYWLAETARKTSGDIIREKRTVIPSLEEKCNNLKKTYDMMQSLKNAKVKIQQLQHELAWSLVNLSVKEVADSAEEYEACSRTTAKYKHNVDICRDKYQEKEAEKKRLEAQLKESSVSAESLGPVRDQLKEDRVNIKDRHRKVVREKERIESDLRTCRRDCGAIRDRIAAVQRKLAESDVEKERQIRNERIARCRKVLSDLEIQQMALSDAAQDRFFKEYTERQKHLKSVSMDIDARRHEMTKLQTSIRHQEAARGDRLRQYGEQTPALIQRINQHTKFRHKPCGPVGSFVTVRDPRWARTVERCLGQNLLRSYCVDNMHDFNELRRIRDSVYNQPGMRKPDIICSKFLNQPHNVTSSRPHCNQPTVLEMLEISNPVITNCLIDQRGVETVLLIENTDEARNLMSSDHPPARAREAFTMSADQLFCRPTYRYYSTSNRFRQELLSTNIEDNIRSQRELLARSQAEVKGLEEERKKAREMLAALDEADEQRQRSVRLNQQRIYKYQHELRDLLNIEDSEPTELNELEAEAAHLEAQTVQFEKLRDEAETKVREVSAEVQETEEKLKSVSGKLRVCATQQEPIQDQLALVAEKMQQAKEHRKHCEMKLRAHLEKVTYLKMKQESEEEKLESDRKKAREICEEKRTNRKPDEIEAQIRQLEATVRGQEKLRGGKLGEIAEKYKEAHEHLERIKRDINLHSRFLQELDNNIEFRRKRFEEFRHLMSKRADVLFRMICLQRNYKGYLTFNHGEEHLDIWVQPGLRSKDKRKMRDLRQLSGGEKSFATVCFLLALWESMELPFRWLDEFDVFMDLVHRRHAFELMLDVANTKGRCCQFVFLTPLDISTLSIDLDVSLFRLEDPRRTNTNRALPAPSTSSADPEGEREEG